MATFFIFKFGIFSIKKIEVEANNISCTNELQIKQATNTLGQNFFLTNKNKTEENLKEKFVCIKSIDFIKNFLI